MSQTMKSNLDERSEKLVSKMWLRYCQLNPKADEINGHLKDLGEDIINDHIALRTFNNSPFSNSRLISFFEDYGYKVNGHYKFEQKKLDAVHMEKSDPNAPKIFISELRVQDCSEFVQNQVAKLLEEVKNLSLEKIFNEPRPWKASHEIYQKMAEESEYASWLYAHGLQVNHFTVFVNSLKSFTELEALNDWLMDKGYKMNTSGGLIKGSSQLKLEQSSTLASVVDVSFEDGQFPIPGCYMEFAKRHPIESTGELFQGFVTGSADKIFESTNSQSNN